MGISGVIEELVHAENNGKTLMFVLGLKAREYIEHGLIISGASTIEVIEKLRHDVEILFLNKLQYLFMFLMKLEAEEAIEYNQLVIYGFETMISSCDAGGIRLINLIFNTLYKVKRKHELQFVKVIQTEGEDTEMSRQMIRIENYWKYVC